MRKRSGAGRSTRPSHVVLLQSEQGSGGFGRAEAAGDQNSDTASLKHVVIYVMVPETPTEREVGGGGGGGTINLLQSSKS